MAAHFAVARGLQFGPGATGDSAGNGMDLWVELRSRRAAILSRWNRLVLEVYPEDSSGFLRREKDRFQNPVGATTSRALEELFEGLLTRRPPAELEPALDAVVRIRAVQDLPPSHAMGFVFLLKRAVREELGDALAGDAPGAALTELEASIDTLGLAAFDLYVGCREQIYQLRAGEVRRSTAKLLERAERSLASAGDDNKKMTDDRDPLKGGSGA